MKVGKSCPYGFHKFSQRFSADSGIVMGVAKRAIFREGGDKNIRIATVPGIEVAAYKVGRFHSRKRLAIASSGVEYEVFGLRPLETDCIA